MGGMATPWRCRGSCLATISVVNIFLQWCRIRVRVGPLATRLEPFAPPMQASASLQTAVTAKTEPDQDGSSLLVVVVDRRVGSGTDSRTRLQSSCAPASKWQAPATPSASRRSDGLLGRDPRPPVPPPSPTPPPAPRGPFDTRPPRPRLPLRCPQNGVGHRHPILGGRHGPRYLYRDS